MIRKTNDSTNDQSGGVHVPSPLLRLSSAIDLPFTSPVEAVEVSPVKS